MNKILPLGWFLKKFIFFLFFIFYSFIAFAQDKISIGIAPPFLKNDNAVTIFYNKHFAFEILFNYDTSGKNLIEVLSPEEEDDEYEYISNSREEVFNNGIDYLLYSSVYSTDSFLFFKVQLINPYTNNIIFSKLYTHKLDYKINEFLSETSLEIINLIDSSTLKSVERKLVIKSKNRDKEVNNEEYLRLDQRQKHEIFFLNGAFKNHPNMFSCLEFITGYNFSPFNYFSIEAGFFIGAGVMKADYSFNNFGVDDLFLGGYGAFYFYFSAVVEPSIGLKFDFTYIYNNEGYFSFPIDFGLKFYITRKNAIRLNSCFQFVCYNFNKLVWENNYVIGLSIGYARKI